MTGTIKFYTDFYGDNTKEWNQDTNAGFQTTAGRTGNGWANCAGPFHAAHYLDTAYTVATATYVMGVACLQYQTSTFEAGQLIAFNSAGAGGSQISIGLDANRYMYVYTGNWGGTVLWSGAGDARYRIESTAWKYIEFAATIHDTTGSWSLRIDGNNSSLVTQTNVDTKGQTASTINSVCLGWVNNISTYMGFDDFYYKNDVGTLDGFEGPIRIISLVPNAEGDLQQFTPSTGTEHWSLLDDPSTTTDYVSSPQKTSAQELCNVTPMPASTGVQIIAATVANYASIDTTGPREVKNLLKVGGTVYEGSPQSLTTSWTVYNTEYLLNPNTGLAWTVDDLAGVQIGIENIS